MHDPKRILLVDDDEDILRGTTTRLTAAGYYTLVACNGDEGIACAAAQHPDAIVLDVCMPHKDGLAALAELRAGPSTRDIPIVMLSASLADQCAALKAGAKFFLRKPYTGPTLINAIQRAIDEGFSMAARQSGRPAGRSSCGESAGTG